MNQPNMRPQRGRTPRNTGSPPPDQAPEPYSRPARTQMAKQTALPANKPSQPTKPTGTAEPERRGMKGPTGDVSVTIPADAFDIAHPSPTPGDGRAVGYRPGPQKRR